MIFWETLRLSLASLAANKLRSGLTILGITVGIFTVIGVMTAVSGVQASIETGLNVLGANSFQITKFPAIQMGPNPNRARYANRPDIDHRTARRFAALMEDEARVSLSTRRGGRRVHHGDRVTNPNVLLLGADEHYLTSFNYDVAWGRSMGRDDLDFARPIALIGQDVRERLFNGDEPLGRDIRIDGQTFSIVGVLAPKGSSFGSSQDNLVVVPLTRWLNVYGSQGRSISLNVQAPSQEALAAVQDHAIGAMRLVRGLAPEDENDFEVFSNDSLIDTFNQVIGTVAVGAFVISAIALLAAGVGVMNIMLVSVTERTREIGIRKSLGARRRSILGQFLLEAVLLSLLGGVGGVIGGIIIGNVAGQLLNAAVVFPVGWALAGLAVCGGIGVSFGLYPAWKAARLDPIEALRYE
jgi:putative ABC transport system permease protein